MKAENRKKRALTVAGYLCLTIVLLAVIPVFLPQFFGYRYTTYLVSTDTTKQVSEPKTLVYVENMDHAAYEAGNVVAVFSDKTKRVDVYTVASNDGKEALTMKSGEKVQYDKVAGHVAAKLPLVGFLGQICFSIVGMIALVIIFVMAIACLTYGNKIAKEMNDNE